MRRADDHEFLLFADFANLVKRSKKAFFLGALLFAFVGFAIAFGIGAKYEARATFRELASLHVGREEKLFTHLLTSAGLSSNEQEGKALFLSPSVLIPVVKKLGLQAMVEERPFLYQLKDRMVDLIAAQRKKPLIKHDPFVFSKVSYDGEEKQVYELMFASQDDFELRTREGEGIVRGKKGEVIDFEGGALTLVKTPKNLELFSPYTLTLHPLLPTMKTLSKAIKVDHFEKSSSLLELRFANQNRQFSLLVLNEVMASYKRYLTKEHNELAQGQLAYLDRRRAGLQQRVDRDWEEYANYLEGNLKEKGFFKLEQEVELAVEKQQGYVERLIELDLEESYLLDSAPLLSSNQQFVHTLLALQTDLLSIEKKQEERREALLTQKSAPLLKLKKAADQIDFDEKKVEKLREQGLASQGNEKWLNKVFGELKGCRARRFELKGASLQSKARSQHEFSGADLQTVEHLYFEALKERDRYQNQVKKLAFAKTQFDQPGFEFGSLVELLSDPASQEMAQKMGQLVQSIRNKRHFGAKERARMEHRLEQQREDLRCHVDQTVLFYQLQIDLLSEKIAAAARTSLDLIDNKIDSIQQEISNKTQKRLSDLKVERHLVEEQIDKLKAELIDFPKRWLKEKQLELSTGLSVKMLVAIAQLVESKNVEHHLATVRSKALAAPLSSPIPKSAHLKLLVLAGSLVGCLITWGWLLLRGVREGFPLTEANLLLRGYPLFGNKERLGPREKRGNSSQTRLETARQVALFLHERKGVVSVLLKEKKSTAIEKIAELLSKGGSRVIVIDLAECFGKAQVEPFGLLSYLTEEREAPLIKKEGGIDRLTWGGSTKFLTEQLKISRFTTYLNSLRKRYDTVLIVSKAPLFSAEAQGFLLFSDTVLVDLQAPSAKELGPYFTWEESNVKNSLGFIASMI